MVACILAAAAARVLAVGDVWEGYTGLEAMMLQDVRWWTHRYGPAGQVLGNAWFHLAVVLLVASLAAPDPHLPPTRRVVGLRVVTLCALGLVLAEGRSHVASPAIPFLLAGLALLVATRRGALPSWQVALGAWVITSRVGWPSRVFARWHEDPLPPCMPPTEALAELAPACIAFQFCVALALSAGKETPHVGLRRLAAVWAIGSALDTAIEVAIGHGLAQRETWTAWVVAWSVIAQGVAGLTALALAASGYRSLREVLFQDELDLRYGRAAIAAVFGLAMLAPVLTRHPIPGDVGDAAFDGLREVPEVVTPSASPEWNHRVAGAETIVIAERWGTFHDATTGRRVRDFGGEVYGVITDRDALVSDFTRVAIELLQLGAFQVHWALPLAVDDRAVGAIPTRFAIGGIARRQLVFANVSAFLASPPTWPTDVPPTDATLHFAADALEDHTPLRALMSAPASNAYRILVNWEELHYRTVGRRWPPRGPRNPLSQLFQDSARTMLARLWPLLAGLVLAYAALRRSVARDLAHLERELRSGLWLRSSEPGDAGLPRFPPWVPIEEAQLVRVEGSPYRDAFRVRAATVSAARDCALLHLQSMHRVGTAYAGVLLVFMVAVALAMAR